MSIGAAAAGMITTGARRILSSAGGTAAHDPAFLPEVLSRWNPFALDR